MAKQDRQARARVTARSTLRSTGRLYLQHWLRFTGLVLATGLVFLLSMYALVTVLQAVSEHARSFVAQGGELSLPGAIVLILTASLPVLALNAIVITAGIAAVSDVTAVLVDGRPASIWGGLRRACRRAPAIIGAGVIVGAGVSALFVLAPILTVVGLLGLIVTPLLGLAQRRWPRVPRPPVRALVLLAVPFGAAVWCSLRWSLFIPAAMLERRGPRRALARSAELVKGRWATVAVVMVLATVVSLLGQLVPGFLGMVASPDSDWVPAVVGGAGQVIFACLPLVAVTMLFLACLGDDGLEVTPVRTPSTDAVRRHPRLRGASAGLTALLILSTLSIPVIAYAPAASAADLPPVVTVESSTNPALPGDPVVLTISVVGDGGIPTGTVTLMDGSTDLGDLTLDGTGTTTFTSSSLAVGIHPLIATYNGDGDFDPASSAPFDQGIRGPSSVTASAIPSPAAYGNTVTFTVTVAQTSGSPVPTGSVSVEGPGGGAYELDGTGTATWTSSSLNRGTFNYSVNYTGDLAYSPSSTSMQARVTRAGTATTLVVTPPGTPGSGDPVTLTATVTSPDSPRLPVGASVRFDDGTTTLGWANVDDLGVARYVTPVLAIGSHSFTAALDQSQNFAASTSGAVTYDVTSGPTATVSVTSSSASVEHRSPVTFSAHVDVTAGSPTGSVEFVDNGWEQLGSVSLDGAGNASFTTSDLSVGDHEITARYNGIASPAITQSVTARPDAAFVVDDLGDAGDADPGDDICATSVGDCTLRAALDEANADGNRAYTVTFSVDGTIEPATTLTMTSSVVIDGAGRRVTIDGNRNIQIMHAWVPGGSGDAVGVANLVFTRGRGTTGPGALTLGATGATVTNVTFYDNDGTDSGGALLTSGSTTITNTTFSENRSSYTYGGADLMNVGVATVVNTTFFEGNGGSIANVGGGSFSMFNSIVKSTTGWACQGTITGTNNMANDSSCPATLVTNQYFDFYGYYGNSMPVAPLRPISPAIDAGRADLCPASDQRGVARPQLAACDLGAYEFLPATDVVVTSSNNPANYGEPVTFTALVTSVAEPIGPLGAVEFRDGATLFATVALDNGYASASIAAPTVGTHTITATFVSSGLFTTSTSVPLTQLVVATTAAVDLTSSLNPAAPGDDITFDARVSGNGAQPTGTVTFLDGTTVLGTRTIDGDGEASLTTSSLGLGAHPITVRYEGDGLYSVTTSSVVSQRVLGATTVSLVTATPTTVYGNDASFTFVVNHADAGTLTGAIACWSGSFSVTVPVDVSGQATCTSAAMPPGTTTISAVYTGDTSFAVSPVATTTHDVTAASTTVTITDAPTGTSSFGEPVTFTATVTASATPAIPAGSIELRDGTTLVGTATLDGTGVAIVTTSALAVGSHPLTATFVPATGFSGSTSGALTHAVTSAATATSLTTSAATTVTGEDVVLTATVTAPGSTAVPTGTVTFLDGTTTIGTATLDGTGVATFTTSGLAVGSHSLTASLAGGTDFQGSASAAVAHAVAPAATTTGASTSPSTAPYGTARTITATVTPVAPGTGTPTGTVTFLEGPTVLGTGTLAGGTASMTTSTLANGTHTVTVDYGGDASYTASTSSLDLTVYAASTTTAITFSAEPTPFGTGTATATITASTGAIPTGSVTFRDFNQSGQYLGEIGTATVDSSGKATITLTATTVGNHRVSASYASAGDFGSSYSEVAHSVAAAATSTSLTITPATSDVLTLFELSATVTSPGAPVPLTGTVTFRDGPSPLAAVAVDASGQARFSTYLPAGSHALTARYDGDARYAWSISAQDDRAVNTAVAPITLAATPSASVYGQTVELSATFAAPGTKPAGNVSFFDGTTLLGQPAIDGNGVARLPLGTLAVGAHSITATYAGDANFLATSSGPVTSTVTLGSTTTTITAQQSNPWPGTPNVFSAHVVGNGSSAVPVGSVTFRLDDTTVLGTVILDGSGNATYTSTMMAKGTHTVTAEYTPTPGPSTFGPSSASVGVTVTSLTSRVSLRPDTSAYSSPWGQTVTFRAEVMNGGPYSGTLPALTGTIEVSDLNGNTCTVAAPAGTCTLTFTTPGNLTVAANYLGDAHFDPTAGTIGYTVLARKPTITQTISADPIVGGQPVTVTWSVSGDGAMSGPTSGSTIVWACGTAHQAMNGSCTFTPPMNSASTIDRQISFFSGDPQWSSTATADNRSSVWACWTTNFRSMVGGTPPPITADPAPNCGSGTGYLEGTQVTLTAPTVPNLRFSKWSPTGYTTPTMTMYISGSTRYQEAFYTNPCVSVTTATYGGSGRVSVGSNGWSINSNCGTYQTTYDRRGNPTYQLSAGTPLTLIAIPGSDGGRDNSFVGWSGDVQGTNPTTTLTVPLTDVYVLATFYNPPAPCFRVTFPVTGDGKLVRTTPAPTCNNGQGPGYRSGDTVTYVVEATGQGYFERWAGGITTVTDGSAGALARNQTAGRITFGSSSQPNPTAALGATFDTCRRVTTKLDYYSAGEYAPTTVGQTAANCPNRPGEAGWYKPGTRVDFTVGTIYYGFKIDRWDGATPLSANWLERASTTADADKTVVLYLYSDFGCRALDVQTVPTGGADVKVTTEPSNCPKGRYPHYDQWGDKVSFSAKPTTGDPFIGWTVDTGKIIDRNGSTQRVHQVLQGRDISATLVGASTVTAYACQRLGINFVVVGADGKESPGDARGTDFIGADKDPNCEPGMVGNGLAWTVGSTVVFGAGAPDQAYAFLGWSGDLSGTDGNQALLFDGAKQNLSITAKYRAICHQLKGQNLDHAEISPKPNCPGKPESERWYLGGTSVVLHALPWSGTAFTGWTGDAERGGDPTFVTMTSDKTVNATYRNLSWDEKAADWIEGAANTFVNEAGVFSKKLVGVLAIVTTAVVNDAVPWGFVNGAVAIGQGIDAVLKLAGVSGGIGPAMGDALKYVQETMTMLNASLTCAAEWASGGSTQQQQQNSQQAFDSGAEVADSAIELATATDKAAAALRDAERLRVAAEVAVRNGEKEGASMLAKAEAAYLTKKLEYTTLKNKYASKTKVAKKLGLAVAIGQGIYDNVATGPGVVWEDDASKAWTSGGDAFMACAARQMPSYMGVPASATR